jgi:hypothetical protein
MRTAACKLPFTVSSKFCKSDISDLTLSGALHSRFDTAPARLYHLAFINPIRFQYGEQQMSVYDSKDLMSFNAASREFDVPAAQLELAASRGTLRVIQLDNGPDGARWLLRPDVEQFVKRTIKRGAGNKVVTRLNR